MAFLKMRLFSIGYLKCDIVKIIIYKFFVSIC
jgi:hypothetical protein